MPDRESFIVTIDDGKRQQIELTIRARNSDEARRLAYDKSRGFPLRTEPIMVHIARTQPFFADELMATIWGV